MHGNYPRKRESHVPQSASWSILQQCSWEGPWLGSTQELLVNEVSKLKLASVQSEIIVGSHILTYNMFSPNNSVFCILYLATNSVDMPIKLNMIFRWVKENSLHISPHSRNSNRFGWKSTNAIRIFYGLDNHITRFAHLPARTFP